MTIKKPGISPTTNRFLNNFLEIALAFIIISIMGLVAYNKIGFYIIHPIFYLMTTIMGIGWLLTVIVIIFESKSIGKDEIQGKIQPVKDNMGDVHFFQKSQKKLRLSSVNIIMALLFTILIFNCWHDKNQKHTDFGACYLNDCSFDYLSFFSIFICVYAFYCILIFLLEKIINLIIFLIKLK